MYLQTPVLLNRGQLPNAKHWEVDLADSRKPITAGVLVKGIFYVLGLAGLVYGFNAFLDDKIERRINDPTATAKIAKGIRPFLIFSGTGIVLADNGALEHIQDLKVETTDNTRVPQKVVITPKRFLHYPPLITGIDQVGTVALPKRGVALSWEYTFETAFVLEPGLGPQQKTKKDQDRYRLEIIY
jgi:hypothetical protein